jgi:hypothetical protein
MEPNHGDIHCGYQTPMSKRRHQDSSTGGSTLPKSSTNHGVGSTNLFSSTSSSSSSSYATNSGAQMKLLNSQPGRLNGVQSPLLPLGGINEVSLGIVQPPAKRQKPAPQGGSGTTSKTLLAGLGGLSGMGAGEAKKVEKKKRKNARASSSSTGGKVLAKDSGYHCDICNKTMHYCSAARHKQTHTGVKLNECPVCNMKFATKFGRNRHMKNKHGDMDQKAVQAQRPRERQKKSDREIKEAEENKTRVIVPATTFHPPNVPIVVSVAPVVQGAPVVQVAPVAVATPQQPAPCMTCKGCNAAFDSSEALKAHIQSAHVQGGEEDPNTERCMTCGKTCKSNKALRQHMMSHNKKHACNYCGHRFRDRSELTRHTTKGRCAGAADKAKAIAAAQASSSSSSSAASARNEGPFTTLTSP